MRPIATLALSFALALSACAALTATVARADDDPAFAGDPLAGEQPDAELLSNLVQASAITIDLGQLATEKASSAYVRRFGDRLARDHRLNERAVHDYARRHGIAMPDTGSTTAGEVLEAKTGPQFDRSFLMAEQVLSRRELAVLGDARLSLADPELRKMVGRLIPILQQHLELATALANGNE